MSFTWSTSFFWIFLRDWPSVTYLLPLLSRTATVHSFVLFILIAYTRDAYRKSGSTSLSLLDRVDTDIPSALDASSRVFHAPIFDFATITCFPMCDKICQIPPANLGPNLDDSKRQIPKTYRKRHENDKKFPIRYKTTFHKSLIINGRIGSMKKCKKFPYIYPRIHTFTPSPDKHLFPNLYNTTFLH